MAIFLIFTLKRDIHRGGKKMSLGEQEGLGASPPRYIFKRLCIIVLFSPPQRLQIQMHIQMPRCDNIITFYHRASIASRHLHLKPRQKREIIVGSNFKTKPGTLHAKNTPNWHLL